MKKKICRVGRQMQGSSYSSAAAPGHLLLLLIASHASVLAGGGISPSLLPAACLAYITTIDVRSSPRELLLLLRLWLLLLLVVVGWGYTPSSALSPTTVL